MEKRIKTRPVFILGLLCFFFAVLLVSLYLFFPYKKALNVVINSLLLESKIRFSVEGVTVHPFSLYAKEVKIGYEGLEGPILKVQNVRMSVNPLAIVKGVIAVEGENSSEEEKVTFRIEDIPVFSKKTPILHLSFQGVPISGYKEDYPFFRSITGKVEGWIREKIYPFTPERNEGSFSIKIKDGEIKGLYIKPIPRFELPYKEIILKGQTRGDEMRIDLLSISSSLGSIKANGTMITSKNFSRVEMSASFEGFERTPIFGKKQIRIYGDLSNPSFDIR